MNTDKPTHHDQRLELQRLLRQIKHQSARGVDPLTLSISIATLLQLRRGDIELIRAEIAAARPALLEARPR